MNKVFYLIIGIVIFFISCDLTTNSKNFVDKQSAYDTLRYVGSQNITDSNDKCARLLNSFHKRFGIVISDYYVVIDSLPINLDNDSYVDTILIVSPLSLEPMNDSCRFNFDNQPKRLLVEILNKNGRAKIRNTYSNLVSDVGGVLSHYNGIFKTEKGFKIVHEAGARYSWLYSMEFSVKKDSLTLIKISKKCSFNNKDKDIIYYYDNISLGKINVPDTLSRQCNCDEFWSELDK